MIYSDEEESTYIERFRDKVKYYDENRKLHRDGDKPAIILDCDNTQVWYRHGIRHRDDGKPALISETQTKWYVDGKLHREDGPAMIINGNHYWFIDGERVEPPAKKKERICIIV